MVLSIFSALVLLVARLSYAASTTCYAPGGGVSDGDIPCNSSAAVSSCCGVNDLCINNGLCFQGGNVARGSCTDQTWMSSDCPLFCQNESPGGGIAISRCGVGPSTWACGNAKAAAPLCNNGSTFLLSDEPAVHLRPEQVASLGNPDGLAVSVNTTLSSNATGKSSGKFNSAQMAGVGVGIGAPLLLALVVLLVYIVKLRKQLKYAQATMKHAHYEDGGWQQDIQKVIREQFELAAERVMREMDGHGRKVELPGVPLPSRRREV